MTWAKSWEMDNWEFVDLAERYDEETANDTECDDETVQVTLIRRREDESTT